MLSRSASDAIVGLCICAVVVSLTLVLDAMLAAITQTCSIYHHHFTGRCVPGQDR